MRRWKLSLCPLMKQTLDAPNMLGINALVTGFENSQVLYDEDLKYPRGVAISKPNF